MVPLSKKLLSEFRDPTFDMQDMSFFGGSQDLGQDFGPGLKGLHMVSHGFT